MTYHWIISIWHPSKGGQTSYGVIDNPSGKTRLELFDELRSYAAEQAGHDGIVMHFSAEPNQL